MQPVITLDGFQFNPCAADGTGFTVDQEGLTGWYDSPEKRTNYIPKPNQQGSNWTPAYDASRVVAIAGEYVAIDRLGLISMQRSLAGICKSPTTLYELNVQDEFGSLSAFVQRTAKVLWKPLNDNSAAYSLAFTAPDARLLDAASPITRSTPMAQPGGTGAQFRGPNAGNKLQNPGFESGVSPWTVTGGTVTQSSTHVHGGTYAAQITPSGSAANVTFESEKIAVTPGATVEVAVQVWATNAVTSNFSCSVNWYNSSNTLLSTSSAPVSLAAATYTTVASPGAGQPGALIAPANAAYASVVPTLSGTPAAAQVFFLDDAMVRVVTGSGFRGSGGSGLSFGAPGPSGIVNLDNIAGTADADIVFTIKGPAFNPTISTATDTIRYGGTLSASDVLVIDTGAKSVLLNGSNRRPFLTTANFFPVPAGRAISVRFTADVQNAQATMAASFRRSYL